MFVYTIIYVHIDMDMDMDVIVDIIIKWMDSKYNEYGYILI